MTYLAELSRDDGAPVHPQPDMPTAAYVVLGMLGAGARSGYEIKRAVDLSARFFWAISPAQIYPSLERLEQAGLIESRSEPRGARRRRTHELTSRALPALRQWLDRREPTPFEVRDLGTLKLFFADALDEPDALRLVGELRARSEQRLTVLQQRSMSLARDAERSGLRYPMLTLRLGIAIHEAMVEVCRAFESESAGAVSDGPRPS
ncbi:MAG TPA: PadR family transcriptional regulator [Solirubrobacteraceae bacterium]